MEEKLIKTLKSYDYRYHRYQVDYSVAMWHCPTNINTDELTKLIRKTDQLVCLDDCTYAVVFDYTTPESSIQALNNLLEHYKCTYLLEPFSTTVLCASQFESVTEMVPQLLEVLNQSMKRPIAKP